MQDIPENFEFRNHILRLDTADAPGTLLEKLIAPDLAAWEDRSIFLNFLASKLPSPIEEDPSKGILDAIDMDSYRVE